jgi:hypothetical protein
MPSGYALTIKGAASGSASLSASFADQKGNPIKTDSTILMGVTSNRAGSATVKLNGKSQGPATTQRTDLGVSLMPYAQTGGRNPVSGNVQIRFTVTDSAGHTGFVNVPVNIGGATHSESVGAFSLEQVVRFLIKSPPNP